METSHKQQFEIFWRFSVSANTVKMPDDREISYNRIFILGGKDCAEADLREAFEKYGTIKDIYMVKDRKSGEPKGW